MPKVKASPTGNPRTSLKPVEAPPENLLPWNVPEPPATLEPAGVAVWRSLWTVGEGVYNPASDYLTVLRYCELQQERSELQAIIKSEGHLVVGSQGQDVLNPLVRVVRDIESKLQSLEDRLGLNPEARIRLGISAAEHKSKLDEFIDKE